MSDPIEIIQEWLHARPLLTQQAYASDIKGLLIHLDGKPLEAVTLRDLQLWQDKLLELHQSPATIARKTSAVRGLFRHAARHGHIERNPATDLPAPTVPWEMTRKAVDRATMAAIIEAAKPGRDRVLIQMLYCTAARVSEICALWWEDLNAKDDGWGEVRIMGKRQKLRYPPVPPAVYQAVLSLRNDAPDNSPIFGISRQTAGEIVKAAAIKAGAPAWFSPHKIRHSTATQALEAKAPLEAVQRLLGHTRPEMTLRYARTTQEKPAIAYLDW
jgi:integrase/recombinase XerD